MEHHLRTTHLIFFRLQPFHLRYVWLKVDERDEIFVSFVFSSIFKRAMTGNLFLCIFYKKIIWLKLMLFLRVFFNEVNT